MSGPPGSGSRRPVTGPRAFVELLTLNGFALAQPLLDIFGRAPDQFIFRGAGRREIVLFGVIVVFAIPLLGLTVEAVVGLVSERARRLVHEGLLAVLATVFLVIVSDHLLPRTVAIAAALVGAGLLLVLYRRTRGPGLWLVFAGPAPILFLTLFLLGSQISPLLRGPAGALGTPVGRRTPTVILLFDELPLASLLDADGEIDADLFPNFARLAGTSHWFRDTTTVANFTWTAVPAMLTGQLPSDGSVPASTHHPKNLFTLVGGAMPVTSSEVITALCPAAVCDRIDASTGGLSALLGDARSVLRQLVGPSGRQTDPTAGLVEDLTTPAGPEGGGELADPEQGGDRFETFLDRLDPATGGLHFLHLLLPHQPFRYLPDGTRYEHPDPDIGRFLDHWPADTTPVDLGRQRHLLQLQWTDAVLGRVLDRLEDTGMFEDTNLIVVSDHGTGFVADGPMRGTILERADDDLSIAQILWVPFFVKASGQTEGVVSDDPVRTVDLTPTVADLLDTEIPWDHDGRSAFDGGSGDPDEVGMFLYAGAGGEGTDAGPYRPLDRDLGRRLLFEHTVGHFAPATDDVTGSDRIFRVGPRPDLHGKRLPEGRFEELDVEIHASARAEDADPSSGMLPALFRADTDAEVGTEIAVTVDGTVWATTRVFTDRGQTQIAAILPSGAFRQGSNTLAVHVLTGADGADG